MPAGTTPYDVLPDEDTISTTVTALEGRGFGVDVVDDADRARKTALNMIAFGSTVMTNTSVTLDQTGIADAVDNSGLYESARDKMNALDHTTQVQERKAVSGQPDFAIGSVHAITRQGELVIASASGSQFANYAWGAARVILVVGLQKVVPDLETARRRLREHSLVLENVRAKAAYGRHSYIGKILEIHQDTPGRIHLVLVRQVLGY
ncbi:LUD domain-containing protein [Streptosporangium sp. NPDC048865]|uniref:LUD domain-containing protein n=1 Tax=Streptosporangium sp. NPDC048865 TaxID=3155766 RepID=UPI003424A310